MTVTFIAHSAYLVEWDKFYTLFDYTYEPDYTGELPELNPDKPLLVFASHSHEDHFDAKVFTLLEKYPDTRFFISRDTRLTERKRQWLNISDEAFARTTVLRPDSILLTDVAGEDLSIRAIKSTDIGNAYLLRCEGKMVYHGGDLNWWDWKIALITMDSIDQHWVTLNEGAQAEAKALGVTVSFMSPNTKDDAQQIECVNNAVAGGYQAIIVAANGPDAISSALKEAASTGVKIVYVDSPANVEAEATFSTDNEAAGKTAGDEMIKALEAAGITSGKIGIVNVNAATDSTVKREAGFRKAFEGKGFELMETQYGEGDAAKSQTIAENYITQGVVGIFGCNEGSTTGTGNAIKASGKTDIVGVGFDKSDAIMNLINDGYLLCTMAQNPDIMGKEGVKAAVRALEGEELGGAVSDTGVSVLKKN